METEQTTTEQPQVQRSFVIPGAEVVISSKDNDPMPVDQFLGIVFQIAASDPEAKVEFYVKVCE